MVRLRLVRRASLPVPTVWGWLVLVAVLGAEEQQVWALKNLHYHSNWFESELKARAIGPIKSLRSWAFVLCFLCIGLSTRFKDLATFGLKPFWAFTIGVLVNVPLGYLLTTQVFVKFWEAIR